VGAGAPIMTVTRDGLVMLTAHEVRAMTGVPVSTLHDWAAKRERGIVAPGPHHLRLSDRHRRWLLDDVKEWLKSTRV
jgi:predicted DNA-binding transcriptional regulator AlpA